MAVSVPFASNYRIEVYLSEAVPACREYLPSALHREAAKSAKEFVWWAPPVAEHAVPSRYGVTRHAAFTQFRLLHVDKVNWWWGHQAQVDAAPSWMHMMTASVESATQSFGK